MRLNKSRPTKRESRLLARKGRPAAARCIRTLPLRRQVVQVRDCIGSAGGKRLGRPPTLVGRPIGSAQSQSARVSVVARRMQRVHMHMHMHVQTRIPMCAFPTECVATNAAGTLVARSRETAVRTEQRCNALVLGLQSHGFVRAIGVFELVSEFFGKNRNKASSLGTR